MKARVIKIKLYPYQYLDKIRPYLSNMINDLKNNGEWKIQLSIAINFISFKCTKETCTMHTKSDNIEIMTGNEPDEIIQEHLNSLLQHIKKT